MARRRRSLIGKDARKPSLTPAPVTRAAGPPTQPEPSPADDGAEAEAVEEAAAEEADASPLSVSSEDAAAAPQDDLGEDSPTEVIDHEPRPLTAGVDPGLEEDAPTEVIDHEPRPRPTGADDALTEDEEPIIGAELTVPPTPEGEDTPEPPEEVQGHLHTAPPVPTEPLEDLPPVTDDSLVIFDERPEESEDDSLEEASFFEDDGDYASDPAVALADKLVDDGLDAPMPGEPDRESPELDAGMPPGFEGADPRVLRGGTPEMAPPRSSSAQAPGFGDGRLDNERQDPPTEEEAGPLPDDLASLYQAPMNVPEPPPIPGILDRYTPAPTTRSVSERPSSARPAPDRAGFVPTSPGGPADAPSIEAPRGLWDETPMPGGTRQSADTPTPPATIRSHTGDKPDDTPIYKDPWFLVVVLVAAVAALIVLIALFYFLPGQGSTEREQLIEPTTISPTVLPVDRPPSDLIPDELPEEDDPDNVIAPSVAPSGEPALVVPTPAPEPIAPAVGTTPQARTKAPKQPTSTKVETVRPTPVARTGKLKIRAARRVLVSIDGTPVGMTPLDVDKPAGQYVISARINGRVQEQRVDLSSGSIRTIEF